MRKLISVSVLAVVSGCVSAPQIAKNDTSATVFVSASALETKSLYPDETVFVRVFTPDQSLQNDRPLSVVTLKPNHASDSFYLNSGAPYKIELRNINNRTTSSDICIAVLEVTPNPTQDYQIYFNAHAPNERCSLIFQLGDKVLVDDSFEKKKVHNIPIFIPISM
jgi:hypothetical protein